MTQGKRLFGFGKLFTVTALGIWIWPLMAFVAWYTDHIPDTEMNLPFAGFLRTHQPAFYKWLARFLRSWLAHSMLITVLLSFAILVGGWFLNELVVHQLGFIYDRWEKIILYLYGFLVVSTSYFGFSSAKYECWDILVWQAEPAAKLLVGGDQEYDILCSEEKEKLKHHVAEASIGINKGTWLVTQGKAVLVNPPADTFAKFGGPGVLVVQEGHAVILEQRGSISGVVGVGVRFLKPFERVNLVVYLALLSEHFDVEHVVTKDKVVIEKMEMYIYHKVDSGDKSRKNGMYPFDVRVILEKVWTPKGSANLEKSANTGGAVRSVANTAVRDVVAQYDLAEVITATGEIRKRVKAEFCEAIERVTDAAMGIKIVVVDIGAVTIPGDAQKKLLDRWLVDWEAQIKRIRGDGEREYLRKQGEGRALAAREEGMAKAEGESERVREMLLALSQLPIDDNSKAELLKTMFQGDQYRDAMRMWSSMGRSGRSFAPQSTGSGGGGAPSSSEETRPE